MKIKLKNRTQIIQSIRAFFAKKTVMEVSTPLLCNSTIPDPYIESFKVGAQYLQSSPEFEMKKLLANGSGCIYQICKAFRREESGRLHSQEFTILEWYRVGFDHHDLMDDMDELLCLVLQTEKSERITYRNLFQTHLGFDPHTTSSKELEAIAKAQKINIKNLDKKDDWLNLLLTHCIEPQLGFDQPTFIYDYPETQSALAKVSNGIAERFEVYYKGIELANGFHELNDEAEQRARFMNDLAIRKTNGQHCPPLDEGFLKAVGQLPDCSGVALGIDRLIMLALDLEKI